MKKNAVVILNSFKKYSCDKPNKSHFKYVGLADFSVPGTGRTFPEPGSCSFRHPAQPSAPGKIYNKKQVRLGTEKVKQK